MSGNRERWAIPTQERHLLGGNPRPAARRRRPANVSATGYRTIRTLVGAPGSGPLTPTPVFRRMKFNSNASWFGSF
jgi:hypothetical protein